MSILKEIATKASVWNRERSRWNSARTVSCPRVFYGFENIGGRTSIVSGGIVKVQDLQESFPNSTDHPNFLYLVSSAIPPYAPLMAAMAKRRGARFVLNQNGVAYPAWHGEGWEKTNVSLRLLIRSADHVFYQSQFCKMAADRFLGPCGGGWEILHNPVDTTVFRPGSPLPRIPLVLLAAGGHSYFYRVETAIRTLHELVKHGLRVRLLLAGRYGWRSRESDATREVEELARTLGVAHLLECRGGYTQEEAVPLFQSAHILLHTQYNDSCPRLVVEAMACGLAVVFSATGGVPELVGQEAGVGVPGPLDWDRIHAPDPVLLSSAVERVAGAYDAFSAAARKRAVRQFDNKAWKSRHEQVFDGLRARTLRR